MTGPTAPTYGWEAAEGRPLSDDRTLYGVLLDNAKMFPDRTALEFLDQTLSYSRLLQRIHAAAAGFVRGRIGPGDRVALCLPNCPQAVICLYALNRIGAVAVLLNPLTAPEELAAQIASTGCKGWVVFDLFLRRLLRNLISIPGICLRVVVDIGPDMALLHRMKYRVAAGLKSLAAAGIASAAAAGGAAGGAAATRDPQVRKWDLFTAATDATADAATDAAADAVVLFSGGTTGEPKPVVHSSLSINATVFQCMATEPPPRPVDAMLTVLPYFHIFGLTIGLHLPLAAAVKAVLVPRFSGEEAAKCLIRQKVTYIAGVPTIYEGILGSRRMKKAEKAGKLDFGRFRTGFCGGDRLAAATLERFNALIHKHGGTGRIVEGYGLTESCPVTTMNRDGSGPAGSLGRPLPGVAVCIMEIGTSRRLPPGEEGEICVFARSMMQQPGQEWLHTGDVGMLDENGYLFLHHRLRRIIKVSGYPVFAGKVEEAIAACPGVRKVCVIGIPDPYSIQRVKAFVVLNPGSDPKKTRRALEAHCRLKLSPWAVPAEIEFIDELPVNLLGKVAFGKLEETGKAGSGREMASTDSSHSSN